MFIVSILLRVSGHYLLKQGNLSLSDFQSGGGVGIKNTEGDIIE